MSDESRSRACGANVTLAILLSAGRSGSTSIADAVARLVDRAAGATAAPARGRALSMHKELFGSNRHEMLASAAEDPPARAASAHFARLCRKRPGTALAMFKWKPYVQNLIFNIWSFFCC